MITLKKFGLYYAHCAEKNKPLPTPERIEQGFEHWVITPQYDENGERTHNDVRTFLTTKDEGMILEHVEGRKIERGEDPIVCRVEMTEDYMKWESDCDHWGWPTLYWG